MLNPTLYSVLRAMFGEIRITNENKPRIERQHGDKSIVIQAGESYDLNCPLCGDKKKRLSISYRWLEIPPLKSTRIVHLAHCYNEDCPVHEQEFWSPVLAKLEYAKLTSLPTTIAQTVEPERPQSVIRLPNGTVSLKDLPDTHPAIVWIRNKYPYFDIQTLADTYGCLYLEHADPIYKLSANRLVFPIYKDNQLVAWQGRTIVDAIPRWYLPPGMLKVIYRLDNVLPTEVPIICEGIPACIACGPNAVAIFGKQMTAQQMTSLSSFNTVLLALDPDTFISTDAKQPDIFSTQRKLEPFVKNIKLIKWPNEILEHAKLAKLKQAQKQDAADLPPEQLKDIIQRSLYG